MKTQICFILILYAAAIAYSQSSKLNKHSLLWGNDIMITDYNNTGKFDCIQTSDGKLYVAAVDNSTNWKTISYYVSVDRGNTWNALPFVQEDQEIIKKVKLVSGANAVFSFYQTGETVKIYNITESFTGNFFTYPQSVNTFDVAYCRYDGKIYFLFDRGTQSEYLHLQSVSTGSGTLQWGTTLNIMEWGNYPKISIYDNKIAMCFFVGRQEPLSNREVHYRFGRINNLGIIDLSSTKEIIPNAPIKNEIDIAIIMNKVYLVFVEQTGTSLDIRGSVSLNEGMDFSSIFNIASEPNKNEQWIDVSNEREFNLSYFEEEIQPGDPTNATNKIAFKFDQNTSELSQFSVTTYASSHPPYWASHEPRPIIVPLNTEPMYDCGILWAGLSSPGSKLYWNRFLDPTSVEEKIELPSKFLLNQNYPNPFNPSTVIGYQLSAFSNVQLKVYDALGREVATLVNEEKLPGKYEVKFDGTNLSSGVYFYKLKAGEFGEIKKLVLMK